MAQRRNQSEHDGMVKTVADYVAKNGFSDVKADLPDFTQPACLYWGEDIKNGHRPDVTGVKDGKTHLFEIETADTIAIEHTASQWRLFSANAKQYNKAFYVVVPKGSADAAKKEIARLNLTADVWEVTL